MPTTDAAWTQFDRLCDVPLSSPWLHKRGVCTYNPDFELLKRLLEVPLQVGLMSNTGMPAKAVDVWIAHELRRAGFEPDEVWPRAGAPRVLPRELAILLSQLPRTLASEVRTRIEDGRVGGVAPSEPRILGKAYVKQVDVVVAQWARGPEILISSKRMGSSLTNNALNRIEESYGDAHNLRGRHPLAAIGYILVLRGKAIREAPGPARRLIDLVAKMAQEAEGYDATSVVIADWADEGTEVELDWTDVPELLQPGRFLEVIIDACLGRTPVDLHVKARELRDDISLPVREADDF
jgi:hypothetical protein